MAERTCRTLVVTIKYVLIQIDKFSFPANFVTLDIKTDPEMHNILGRSFMKIARMLLDIDKDEVKV